MHLGGTRGGSCEILCGRKVVYTRFSQGLPLTSRVDPRRQTKQSSSVSGKRGSPRCLGHTL